MDAAGVKGFEAFSMEGGDLVFMGEGGCPIGLRGELSLMGVNTAPGDSRITGGMGEIDALKWRRISDLVVQVQESSTNRG